MVRGGSFWHRFVVYCRTSFRDSKLEIPISIQTQNIMNSRPFAPLPGRGVRGYVSFAARRRARRLSSTVARPWLRDCSRCDVWKPGWPQLAVVARASVRWRGPWPRKHLQKSSGARCGERRRMIPPDSHQPGRNVRVRGRRRKRVVG